MTDPLNDNCICGHVLDEHGHDPNLPGSTKCNVDGCDCICFDADPDYEQAEDIAP